MVGFIDRALNPCDEGSIPSGSTMPRKDKEKYNEYMGTYMDNRYRKRRQEILDKLGNVCAYPGCGSTAELEIDHIDAKKKSFNIGKRLAGIAKCQLLCKKHHTNKSIFDCGKKPARNTHGTHSALRYCKPICDVCREFRLQQWRIYRERERGNGSA